MSKTIKIRLSKSSISNAISQLKEYKKELEDKTNLLQKELAENGVKYAKDNISDMDRYGTLGTIASGIQAEHSENKSKVHSTDIHSSWVEFGVGVRGQNSPHEMAGEFGWSYNQGSHIGYWNVDGTTRYGWWYPTTADDPNIYTREVIDRETNEPTGEYIAFTEGTEARPFMYNASIQLRNEIYDTARKVFKD